ncbi:MAG: ATP-binding protein [Candidatus Wenzhouxiangella sp. M2_3B_020]
MKLRTQLLLVTALVLLLPLLGLQFVGQVERLLRAGLEEALIDSTAALATVVPRPGEIPQPGTDPIYVHAARQPLLLDGYGDDWAGWLRLTERLGPAGRIQQDASAPLTAQRPLALALAQSPSGLHVLLRMHDADTRFADAGGRLGERVTLRFAVGARVATMEITPAAPGRFTRAGAPSQWPVVHGNWQVHADGWNLELRIPLRDRPERFGLTVTDVDADRASRFGIEDTAPLVARDPLLTQSLGEVVPARMRAWIVTPAGYVLAFADGAGGLRGGGTEAPSPWQALLFERLAGDALSTRSPPDAYSARLSGDDLSAAREGAVQAVWMIDRDRAQPIARVRVAMPLAGPGPRDALLVVERDADALMLLASEAVLRLAGASVLTFAIAAVVLLGFAALLSLRIRRLQRAAENAVADDGRVVGRLAPARGGDELAGLSRSMAALLERLRVHQQYLRTLADRLAHELRTPLAMIDSSLANLGQHLEGRVRSGEDPGRYLERAGQGSRRLNRILQAMSQAARLEEALIDEPFERFDLAGLVKEYCAARQSAEPDCRIVAPAIVGPVRVDGSPDLVAQLMDKLFDNARDFVPDGGRIEVRLRTDAGRAVLEVENEGVSIDPSDAEAMFEPMVSHRPSGGEVPHLGLGLFIARLIAERHAGRLSARPTASGTCFAFALPLARRNRGEDQP